MNPHHTTVLLYMHLQSVLAVDLWLALAAWRRTDFSFKLSSGATVCCLHNVKLSVFGDRFEICFRVCSSKILVSFLSFSVKTSVSLTQV